MHVQATRQALEWVAKHVRTGHPPNPQELVAYYFDSGRFILGSFIASNVHAALFLSNCDILGVKIIRIDPLEPNIWLYYVYYAVLQLFF